MTSGGKTSHISSCSNFGVYLRYYKQRFYQTEKHADRWATGHFSVQTFKKLLHLCFCAAFQGIKFNVLTTNKAVDPGEMSQEPPKCVCINPTAHTQKDIWTLATQQDQSPDKRTPHSKSVLGVISLLLLAVT